MTALLMVVILFSRSSAIFLIEVCAKEKGEGENAHADN